MDDGIREIRGGTPQAAMKSRPLLLLEQDDAVKMTIGHIDLVFTPEAVRFLTRQLNRLALRIERRNASAAGAGTAETRNVAQGEARQSGAQRADAQTPSPITPNGA